MLEDSHTPSDQGNMLMPQPRRRTLADELEENEANITLLKGEIRRAQRRARFYLYGILAILGIAALVVYWSSFHLKELLNVNPHNLYGYLFFGLIFAGLIGLLTLIYFGQQLISEHVSIRSFQADLGVWVTKKSITNQFAVNFEKPSYCDSLVRMNVEHLAAYYTLVKGHTEKSFRITARICISGFFLIAAGIIISISKVTNSSVVSYVTIASGLITEIIASVYFSHYTRTVRQMRGYADSLNIEQNILLSLKLLEDTHDENEKAKVLGQTLAYLVQQQNSSTFDAKENAGHRPATVNRKK